MLCFGPKGRGFEPQRRHCVVALEQDTFILAPRTIRPCLTVNSVKPLGRLKPNFMRHHHRIGKKRRKAYSCDLGYWLLFVIVKEAEHLAGILPQIWPHSAGLISRALKLVKRPAILRPQGGEGYKCLMHYMPRYN